MNIQPMMLDIGAGKQLSRTAKHMNINYTLKSSLKTKAVPLLVPED